MIKFIKKLLGLESAKPEVSAPYKVEAPVVKPAQQRESTHAVAAQPTRVVASVEVVQPAAVKKPAAPKTTKKPAAKPPAKKPAAKQPARKPASKPAAAPKPASRPAKKSK